MKNLATVSINELNSPLLLVSEAAKYLRISESTLRRMMGNRKIDYMKMLNGRVMFTKKQLDEFIDAQEVVAVYKNIRS